MCNESELELEAMSSATAARKGKGKGKARARARSGVPGLAAGRKKVSAWTGVRFRHSGKWSTEIRVPRTREKVWIGTFSNPRQAALAYDAAVFCLFGERTPKSRRINFPDSPRPEIPETARVQLSIADMKAISEKHARAVDALLPPLAADADSDGTAAPPADDQVQVVAPPATAVAVHDAPCACARRARVRAAPPDSRPDEPFLDDDMQRLINTFGPRALEAFDAELEALTFLVPADDF